MCLLAVVVVILVIVVVLVQRKKLKGLVIIPKGRNAIKKKADRIRKNVQEVTNVIIEKTRL